MQTDSSSPSKKANRLLHETSPYLQQHAYNPVDWYPWGEEAFARSQSEHKPIFLSIGYSACHWCHVMEHESFENEEISAYLNEHFISIKVDREERPDLDQIYMTAVQLMTQHGGWPMSVFLTPEKRPFFGGTYWPPSARGGMPGFSDVLRGVQNAWAERQGDVQNAAESLTTSLQQTADQMGSASLLSAELIRTAGQVLCRRADRTHGGFGGAPKFPHSMDLRVLLRYAKRFDMQDGEDVVRKTLDKMAAGGIYDHLGGGFHRYATDVRWLIPHFEKMLYDNALLIPVYLEAALELECDDYRRVVRETLTYMKREMQSPAGGFYSTQDADSEGVEGKFFVWQQQEIFDLLGKAEGDLFCRAYDVTLHGNWEETNILNRPRPAAEVAKSAGISVEDLENRLAVSRETLRLARENRIHPGRDEKILVAWNGMMIAAAATAARILDEPEWSEMAEKAADFVLAEMRQPNGGLWHTHKDGRSHLNAYLDDYACLADGLLELFLTTGKVAQLEAAAEIAQQMIDRFHDNEAGGFFYTSHDHEEVIARQKDLQDNATPSGNSMAAWVLARLGYVLDRSDWEELARETLGRMNAFASQYPSAAGQMLLATDFCLGPVREFVLVPGEIEEENRAVRSLIQNRFEPNSLLFVRPAGVTDEQLPAPLKRWFHGKQGRQGRATLYLCQRGTCGLPAVGLEAICSALEAR